MSTVQVACTTWKPRLCCLGPEPRKPSSNKGYEIFLYSFSLDEQRPFLHLKVRLIHRYDVVEAPHPVRHRPLPRVVDPAVVHLELVLVLALLQRRRKTNTFT